MSPYVYKDAHFWQKIYCHLYVRGEDGWLAAQFIMFAVLMIAEAPLWPTAFNGALFFISAYVCFLIADRDDASTHSEAA